MEYDLAGEKKGIEVAKEVVHPGKDAKLVVRSMSVIGAEEIKRIYPSAL